MNTAVKKIFTAALLLCGVLIAVFLIITAVKLNAPEPAEERALSLAAYRSPSGNRESRVSLSEEAEKEALELIAGREWEQVFRADNISLLTGIGEPVISPIVNDYRIFVGDAEYGYCSRSGTLIDTLNERGANLTETERKRLNTILGVGAVIKTVLPEGCLSYRVAAARLDTRGDDAAVSLEYYNDTDDYVFLPQFFSVFYMENGTPEHVGSSGEGEYGIHQLGISPGVSLIDYSLSMIDLSREGVYRMCFYQELTDELIAEPTPSEAYIEFAVEEDEPEPPALRDDERTLRGKYPKFFDLDTTYGLCVYVWQMARNQYECAILAGRDGARSWEEKFTEIEGSISDGWLTPDIAKQILAIYDLPEEKVHIIPYRHPFSSYPYYINPLYKFRLEIMFFGDNAGIKELPTGRK